MHKPTVLIVGAGPTGLTLACVLARAGVAFRLIEAAGRPQVGSRGKGLQPRSLEVFEDLGIIARVLANGQMAMPMNSTGPDGKVTLGGAIPDELRDRPDIPYAASLITPQWRTEEALRLRLEELGSTVEFGTSLVRFESSSAVFVNEGVEEIVSPRWIVGCDGGHSLVRKLADIPFVGETREEVRMIVADVAVDGRERDGWHMWRHQEGLISLCPLPSTDLFAFQASIVPGQDPALTLANMQAILERRTGRSDIRLHEPEWSSLWRSNVRLVDRYREGHVFLAGDAAHIHSPAGGQGMNTGIQDAYNLGWKLAAVANGADPALLDTYEAERRPIAAGVLALSNARMKDVIEKKGLPTRRDASTLQLDVNYRGSSLATDDRDETATLRAGDRAPDAKLSGDRRLFDLIGGGRFTLLCFGPEPTLGADVRTLRVDEAATAYGANDRTLVLLRPDGYIALISDAGDPSAVASYVAKLLG